MSDAPIAPVSEAPVTEATETELTPEAKPEPRKFKLKVDGQDWEADEEEVKKFAQLGRASTKRFEEASRAKQEAEAIKTRLKTDWVNALKEQGISREDIEKYLGQELRNEMMSPEERAARDMDNENKSLKQKLQDIEDAKETAKYEREQQQYEAQLEKEIPAALDKAGLPRSPATLKRIANHLLVAMEGGYDMSVEEAAEMTRMELKSDLSHLLSQAGKFDDLIPPTVAEKLMQSHLAKVKSAPTFKAQNQAATQPQAPKKTYTEAEWKKMFTS